MVEQSGRANDGTRTRDARARALSLARVRALSLFSSYQRNATVGKQKVSKVSKVGAILGH
jgi:hypothetical protein